MSKILHLHLKKKYFDDIASGKKAFEFRRVTDYWRKRLIDRHYDAIWLYCGYPERGDESKIIKRRWTLVAKETILHEEFGSKPVEVFCISVSEPLRDLTTFAVDTPALNRCGDCGSELQIVRPGKWQCPACH